MKKVTYQTSFDMVAGNIYFENEAQVQPQNEKEEMIDICLNLFKEAVEENKITDLEMIRRIVNQFGENGYPAIDSKNQVNMTEAQQVVQFCEKVDAKEEANISIIEVDDWGGFFKYDLRTKDGAVDVGRSYYEYKDGTMQEKESGGYTAKFWNYKDGYLMFSGEWFSKEQYVLSLSDEEEHKAFRVQPLDETCRELNRKYLLPIGYERNNLFLTDWSEEDFGELDFYDMYDLFYPIVNGKNVPYLADDNLAVGAVYQIPKDEFERVIMTYFNIDSETLQSKTTYHREEATYEYKPRGYYETEYPEYPYSEVVGYTNNSDGTIALTVQVVFPYDGISKVYDHEVVVRPLKDGGVQYASNKIIPSEENKEGTWYTPRLTEEEWEEIYGEKEALQKEAFTAAESVSEIYKDIEIVDAPGYTSGIREFTSEQRKAVVEELELPRTIGTRG